MASVGAGNVSTVKFVRFVRFASPLVVGAMLVLYGALALTFNERGGSTYVTLVGHPFDARRVGAICLVLGLTVIAAGVGILRHRRIRS